jgi:cytochrome c oxidase subunit 1
MSDHHPTGIMRWIKTTNHKDIGTLYLWFSFIMFLTGGSMAMVIRAELMEPGMQVVDPLFFNSMTTMHGLIMVFGAVMPAMTGLANWLVPMMIGAPDMALPRMNNWSFWILPFAAILSAGHSMHRCRLPSHQRVLTSLSLQYTCWVCHPSWVLSTSLQPF